MKKSTAKDLLPLIEKLTHLLNKDAFKEVETLLLEKAAEVDNLTLEEMITYLRCTFSNRAYFQEAWELFKETSIKAAAKEGLDTGVIFLGLE